MKRINLLLLLLAFFAITSNAKNDYAEHSVLASGKWVKISVSNEGVYALSKSKLKSMGFSDPSKVRLYGYNRPILPENYINTIEDDLVEIPLYRGSSTGDLLFYSKGVIEWTRTGSGQSKFTHKNNPYSKVVCYFVTESDSAPAEFKKVENKAKAGNTQNTFYDHALIEKDEYSFKNLGRRFFESYAFTSGASKTYNLTLTGNVKSDVILDVAFAVPGSTSSTLTVKQGSNDLKLNFSKYSTNEGYEFARHKEGSKTISDYSLQKMSITLSHSGASNGHLDYIRASYERPLDMESNNYLAFTPNKSGFNVFEISRASSSSSTAKNIAVWNVTSPKKTYELAGTYSTDSATSKLIYNVETDSVSYTDNFVVVNTDKSFPAPDVVGNIANQDLHSLSDLDLVIITPANKKLDAQAWRLANLHSHYDKMSCYVVSADQVYNEFSSGTPDATAYRRLMKMLWDRGTDSIPSRPKNLLLFGACLWDNRMVTTALSSYSQDDYLLCYESDNSWSTVNSYVLEDYFGHMEDITKNLLTDNISVGVGRIPVKTESVAKDVVNKLESYISRKYSGSWENLLCFLADDGNTESDADTHIKAAEDNIQRLLKQTDGNNSLGVETNYINKDIKIKRIYWDTFNREQTATGNSYPDAVTEINKVMESGALVMNYQGHGSPTCLSHEQVIRIEDFKKWSSPRLPLWITAACETTPFDMNEENNGVSALLNSKGAAMSVVGTSRTVYGTPNATLNKAFMRYLLSENTNGERNTIGEALYKAKNDSKYNGVVADGTIAFNRSQFVLMGDPAITLPKPEYKVVIDKFNEIPKEEKTTISAGDVVTIEGHIEIGKNIADDFDGIISPTVYDNKETVKCKNNSKYNDYSFSYEDYTRKLFEGTDSVKNGKFTITFPVPMDNNYSKLEGIVYFYAINADKTKHANGSYTNFIIGGTSTELAVDTIGPSIITKINSANTIDGERVNETPTLYIYLNDSSGINCTGTSLGHDIVAIIDGKEATTYNLNGYFTQTIGDYTSGVVEYTLPTLEAGKHTLTVRAFDTYNNKTEMHYSFEVIVGLEKVVEIYDFAGRLITTDVHPVLPRGIYIEKTRYMSGEEEVTHSSKKLLIR